MHIILRGDLVVTITIYNVSDAPNVADKTLESGTTVTGVQPCEPCDFLNPSFIMNKSSAVLSGNYIDCVIEGNPLQRKYFITDKQLITGGRVLVSCTVDVLTTYASSIKACNGTILRAESPKSKAMHDSKYPLVPRMFVKNILYKKTPFSYVSGNGNYNYLLTVVGGGT